MELKLDPVQSSCCLTTNIDILPVGTNCGTMTRNETDGSECLSNRYSYS